jgi:hypothetical protein
VRSMYLFALQTVTVCTCCTCECTWGI